jgi:hypothetical protein
MGTLDASAVGGVMLRLVLLSSLLMCGMAAPPVAAQETKVPARKALPVKIGKDEKVCQYKFPSGEVRTWTCKKEEPCCAWDAISYVKCGSTITGCL